ncbi:MAG: hypothetical protein WCO51_11890 [bacterium]
MRWIIMLLLAIASIGIWAETTTKVTKEVATVKPAETIGVDPLLEALDDIRMLDTLYVLKLEKKQILGILKTLDVQRATAKKMEADEAKDLIALKDDILKQRKASLNGTAADEKFYKKVSSIFVKSSDIRKDIGSKAIKTATKDILVLLNEDQKKIMLESSRQTLKDLKDPGEPKATDDQLYWYYIENVLIPPRVYTLLQELSAVTPEKVKIEPATK